MKSVCACAQIPLQYCLNYFTRFLWYPLSNTMGWESDRLVERQNSSWISLLSRSWYDNNFILRLKSKPFRKLRHFIKTTWWFANYFLHTVYLRGISKTRFPSTPCQKQEVEMRWLSGVQFWRYLSRYWENLASLRWWCHNLENFSWLFIDFARNSTPVIISSTLMLVRFPHCLLWSTAFSFQQT